MIFVFSIFCCTLAALLYENQKIDNQPIKNLNSKHYGI